MAASMADLYGMVSVSMGNGLVIIRSMILVRYRRSNSGGGNEAVARFFTMSHCCSGWRSISGVLIANLSREFYSGPVPKGDR